jgi:hypothetical protein
MALRRIVFAFLFFSVSLASFSKDVVCLQKTDVAIAERKAILVLPGLGSNPGRVDRIQKNLEDQGFDLFIPDYKDRKSVAGSVENLFAFSQQWNLKTYKEVHVFAFILGSWTLNIALEKAEFLPNLTSVVYDRGPVQERVAAEMIKSKRLLYTTVVGDVLEDFSRIKYVPNTRNGIRIGVIIETGVSNLAYKFRDGINAGNPITFLPDSLHQKMDDHIFIPMGHDDMYDVFESYSTELFSFFNSGRFTDKYRKEPAVMNNYKINKK